MSEVIVTDTDDRVIVRGQVRTTVTVDPAQRVITTAAATPSVTSTITERITVRAPGPQGAQGPVGPPGVGLAEVFVQAAVPVVPVGQAYQWFRTGLGPGGADFDLIFGVGPASVP